MTSYNLKRIAVSCLMAGFAILSAPVAEAQKPKKEPKKKETAPKPSKDEKKAKAAEDKALKAELASFGKNLESYKQFKAAKATAEAEAGKLKSEVVRLKELEAQCSKEVEGLRSEIEDLLKKLKDCEGKPSPPSKGGFSIPTTGLYYVVQIGAFQNANVETNPDNPDFRKESADGFNKYIMGVFSTIDQADALRSFVSKIDFRRMPQYRPFIVPYKDGSRITLEEAIGPEEAAKRKKMQGQ
ncbi:MAG: SPOR domain-containing protein [Bacteroidetes bacterium]|nr:MAG: SPOR domain-containing protein [Bacteroidota bacterium]